MAVVVKWKADGDYLVCLEGYAGDGWLRWGSVRADAMRFSSREHAVDKIAAHTGNPREEVVRGLGFVRLVPKRRAEPSPDAVFLAGVAEGERRAKVKAGELATSWENDRRTSLRLMRGQSESGQQFMLGGINSMALRALQIRKAFGLGPTDPGKPPTVEPALEDAPKEHTEIMDGGVKVTAPVEMSLGEVWAALTSAPALRVCLDGETRRAREQGATEMRERAAVFLELFVGARIVAAVRSLPLDDQSHGSPAAPEVSTYAGMSIERRGGDEYLVGAPETPNKCCATGPNPKRFICTYHHAGEHVATYPYDGGHVICDRWPIEASQ
jgi:hypothetical protein